MWTLTFGYREDRTPTHAYATLAEGLAHGKGDAILEDAGVK
jgi:hypothetical protein